MLEPVKLGKSGINSEWLPLSSNLEGIFWIFQAGSSFVPHFSLILPQSPSFLRPIRSNHLVYEPSNEAHHYSKSGSTAAVAKI